VSGAGASRDEAGHQRVKDLGHPGAEFKPGVRQAGIVRLELGCRVPGTWRAAGPGRPATATRHHLIHNGPRRLQRALVPGLALVLPVHHATGRRDWIQRLSASRPLRWPGHWPVGCADGAGAFGADVVGVGFPVARFGGRGCSPGCAVRGCRTAGRRARSYPSAEPC
jgi:hypothetical protein